tara:strand:+ start:1472 stop:2857 length:1386 start_codon:yes stop_codon:yes gene_type:complete
MDINHTILIRGGKLVGEGVDGCVHTPPLFSCKINRYMNNKYVSKLQFHNIYSFNELNASNLIKSKYKKSYTNHFSIILKQCTKNLDEITDMSLFDKETCTFFQNFQKYNHHKYKSDSLFSISIYKYILGYPLKVFFDFNKIILLYQNDTFQYFKQSIINFFYLQKSIFMMYNINLVHNDLHYNNIIINTNNNNLPVIIDFGRSFKIDFNDENSYHNFFSYFNKFNFKPERTWDSFDVRFIYYILKHKSFLPFYYNKSYNKTPNFLNIKYIDDFIHIVITYDFNYYKSISNNQFDFNKIIIMYKKFLQDFLYKFSDINSFPFIDDVVHNIYSNYILYNVDSYSVIFNFLDFFLSNYNNLSKIYNIHIFNNIFIKYLFVNINPIYSQKFLYKNHLNFFKYVYYLFNSDQFNKKQNYLYFQQTMFNYFKKSNVDIHFFIQNDILKSLYDFKSLFLSIFKSLLSP